MKYDGIVIIDIYSGLPLFSKLETIEEALFSGFLTAIVNFSEEMSLGALSNFSTDEKQVYLIAKEHILVALIVPETTEQKDAYAFASEVATAFEDKFEFPTSVETTDFNTFATDLAILEAESNIPFAIKVAEFAAKEFGGEISLHTKVMSNEQQLIEIDLIANRGEKKSGSIRDKGLRKMFVAYSGDVIFAKIIDGTAGKGEIVDFLQSMQLFGKKPRQSDLEIFPYFPAKAVIIARDYSPTVFEALDKFQKRGGKTFIAGSHIAASTHVKFSPDTSKCFVELWKWYDDAYPERVYK